MWLSNFHKLILAYASTYTANKTSGSLLTDMTQSPLTTTKGLPVKYVKPYTASLGIPYMWVCSECSVTSQHSTPYDNWSRIVVGSGTTPVSPSDYCLECENVDLDYISLNSYIDADLGTLENVKTMKNKSSSSIIISEVGIVVSGCSATTNATSNTTNEAFLVYRDVLNTPIEVGPGEVFSVSITHQFPTA